MDIVWIAYVYMLRTTMLRHVVKFSANPSPDRATGRPLTIPNGSFSK